MQRSAHTAKADSEPSRRADGQGAAYPAGSAAPDDAPRAPPHPPTTTDGQPARGLQLPSYLAALRHRNYRLLWFGNLISNTGDWMDQVALNWLVYQLTDSAVYLGLVNLCRFVPILLFTLLGGVVADRWERRRLMFSTQAVAMILALILAILVGEGLVQPWMVLVIAAGRGIMMSFNQPAKQSLVSELVPREDLSNAIALNSANFNLTRIIGPVIGGVLIATVGMAGAFFINAASFVAVLGGLALMRFPPRTATPRRGVLDDVVGGVEYVRTQPTLQALLVLALLPVVLGMPYMTILTVFARDVLEVGGTGLGLLTACASVGALLGALYVAATGPNRRGLLMLGALVLFGLSLAVFSFSHSVWLSALMLLAVGWAQQVYMTTNNTIVQERVAEEFRGRVLSIVFLNRGMIPLGTMLAGFGTAVFGVERTMGAMAAALVLVAALAVRFAPSLRELS
jgi:MFS transporter, DHA1 family, staphyloferrin A biosynthesis exporter